MSPLTFLTVLVGIALAGAVGGAAAMPRNATASPSAAAGYVRRDGQPLTLDEAVDLVQRRFDARAVRAEQTLEGDAVVYRIRLLAADGRVFTVRVNARTGRVE